LLRWFQKASFIQRQNNTEYNKNSLILNAQLAIPNAGGYDLAVFAFTPPSFVGQFKLETLKSTTSI
jgi:hypothetical protein